VPSPAFVMMQRESVAGEPGPRRGLEAVWIRTFGGSGLDVSIRLQGTKLSSW
jgi:hypothetical protein